ncbi:DUF5361 domain-containing protein [Facklamia sp. 7083-14-GEN3]|uniref:DUF5361 domain-containing protein n=1 Tax=Facklamia sp. 7083-14-GEN3 TaxID=2973478 RepID=UPI00215BC574|nr:DUF5361 domain-containing protein [Facklamia sp. 7083-14-GEN3]MCR8969271.1 DUF5361 domain-containing protein [Facklamia sp. 7083-14-GEN3]
MIALDEEALICDLAETYNIYEYRRLPATMVAVFAAGLRDNSRIKMKMSDQKITVEQMLLASIMDQLAIQTWFKTKDGQKNKNRPQSIFELLTKEPEESKVETFTSGEDFEKYRMQLIESMEGGN